MPTNCLSVTPSRRIAHFTPRGNGVDIADNFDDTGTLGLEGLFQRPADLARLLDTNPFSTHCFGHCSKAYGAKLPQLTMIAFELPAVSILVDVDFHVERPIVVDEQDRVDVPAHRGFQ